MLKHTSVKTAQNPVSRMLEAYASSQPSRFHMPGHKGFLNPWDITELSCTDNLLTPSGALVEAQEELAEAYGANTALFCTGGSTLGVIAMLLTLPQGSVVAIGRNAHRSAVSALFLGGHRPIWLLPDYSKGKNGQISAATVEAAFKDEPTIKAVLITSPDYLGRCADLCAISCACRAHGALLLVDGAHGAHFALSAALPESPGALADMWVTSAHKTLPCPNQGAYLFGNNAEEAGRLKDALFTVHTTSPSFVLLAALDSAWRTAKEWDYAAHVARLDSVRKHISAIAGLDPYPKDCLGVCDTDATRLVISVCGRGITGYEADVHLQKHGVFVEMADAANLVAITSPIDPDGWYDNLVSALTSLPQRTPKDCREPRLLFCHLRGTHSHCGK